MDLSEKIKNLPHQPGVYLMRDSTGQIIYVGKAKDLYKRVGSYFTKTELPPKVGSLIQCIRRIDYISTSTENDAYVLENKLIKRYQPRYNVLLRDDKTYPYIKLTVQEDFPRLLLTRQRKRDGAVYFGPYPQVRHVRSIMRWIQKRFSLRPCSHEINRNAGLPEKKYRSCLYLHIGTCPAPCTGKLDKKNYDRMVQQVHLFLTGNHADLKNLWEKQMHYYASRLQFEKAQELRDLLYGLMQLYERVSITPIREEDIIDRTSANHSLSVLKKELDLARVPIMIEAFDISHIQGSQPVGSSVCFKHGLPFKSRYRRYHIKTIRGSHDTGMMAEVLERRFKPETRKKYPLPHLVLVDGGKPQLSAAQKVFSRFSLPHHILAALAKKEEEIYRPGIDAPIRLPMDSPGLLLLRRIRDEAHRFARSFHDTVWRAASLRTKPDAPRTHSD
ncbi:MAG: excinuclease ABC subunit UvrC [Elusimicrobia bacterium]|nr:excinuclease ABC subunit UvrC [Elusimicrobiota bacterium]MBD3412584.1 excinuclease ABC subunit UvrC [Elusimicrobiota bacterium]